MTQCHPTTGRPNVLLVYADQHRYDCLGMTGKPQGVSPLAKTPHLDRLAAEGVRFTRAYCPIAVCIPSRNSLMHGQWPGEHLSIANWGTEAPHPPQEGLPALSQVLREAGYFLGHVGKWHIHPQRGPLEYGFHQHRPGAAHYEEWRAARGLPPRPRVNGWFGEVDPFIGPDDSRSAWEADGVLEVLEAWRGQDRPFFIQWDSDAPHLPNVVPEPYFSMYSSDDIPPWPSFPDPLIGKPYIQAQQRRTWKVEGWTWEQWAPVVRCYLAEVSLLDAQVGRVLNALEHMGIAEQTMVIYSTDHGDLCGGHGMVDKHYVMYEDVTRVPLIVRWPGRTLAGTQCDAWVSHNIDLAMTLCDVAGVPAPATFRGKSLLPLLTGGQDNGRQDIFCMYHGNQFGLYSQRMVRDARWKYVWNATAEDEMYDLELDPGELRNLATNPAYRGELERLRQRLVAWMEETHDPLLNSWTRTQLLEGLTV